MGRGGRAVPGGNTPTSVGKTLSQQRRSSGTGKHPHERGEDVSSLQNVRQGRETPPRAWGRRQGRAAAHQGQGNTPTSVGKTGNHAARSGYGQKHPHERGEDAADAAMVKASTGNTPTSVGKTCRKAAWRPSREKHPHERGEDFFLRLGELQAPETPPRAWGRRNVKNDGKMAIGNTPTSVGKTKIQSWPDRGRVKHPHERGEDREWLYGSC